MTSPPGYIRSRTGRERAIDRAWAALRMAGAAGRYISASQITDQHDIGATQLKRLIRAADAGGWLETTSIVRPHEKPGVHGAAVVRLYRLTPNAPVDAPALRATGDGGFIAVTLSDVSGVELKALRQAQGWSLQLTAQMIGVRTGATVSRYEAAARLPIEIGRAVARLLATPSDRRRKPQKIRSLHL